MFVGSVCLGWTESWDAGRGDLRICGTSTILDHVLDVGRREEIRKRQGLSGGPGKDGDDSDVESVKRRWAKEQEVGLTTGGGSGSRRWVGQ